MDVFTIVGVSAVVLVASASFMWLKSYQKKVALRPKGRKLMLILGSGGHTGEMLNLIGRFCKNFQPRVYVAARNDMLSIERAREQEVSWETGQEVVYVTVTRVRNVGETVFWALFRIPLIIVETFYLILKHKPDAIICNGPGICVPICVVARILKSLKVLKVHMMFTESICRVKDVSVTGHFLIYVVDDFIVQWEELKERCAQDYPGRRVLFWGRLS